MGQNDGEEVRLADRIYCAKFGPNWVLTFVMKYKIIFETNRLSILFGGCCKTSR